MLVDNTKSKKYPIQVSFALEYTEVRSMEELKIPKFFLIIREHVNDERAKNAKRGNAYLTESFFQKIPSVIC